MSSPCDDALVRDLETMSCAVNYRNWIYSQFSEYIGRRVIEIGAGIGNFTNMLLDRELVVAIDNHRPSLEVLKRNFMTSNNVIPLEIDVSSPDMLELRRYGADSIICINVLEHVKEDRKTLSYMYDVLKEGGRLLLLVPAFQILYGSIDRVVGHQRRYSKKELLFKLRETGFQVLEIYYMNFIATFGWFLNNRILLRKEESPSQVLFFDRYIVPWLERVESIMRPPFGLSIIAICGKEIHHDKKSS